MARNAKADRQSFIGGLKDEVAELLASTDKLFADMTGNSRTARLAFLGGVRESVDDLREAVADDMAGVRKAWSGRPRAGEPRGGAKPKAGPERKKAATGAKAPAKTATAQRDDLTVIKGIGPKTQDLLNRAGVYTYAQLARKTPEQLRHIVNGSPTVGKSVGQWPGQARELAGV